MKALALAASCALLHTASAGESWDFTMENARRWDKKTMTDAEWKRMLDGKISIPVEFSHKFEDRYHHGMASSYCPDCKLVHAANTCFRIRFSMDTRLDSPDTVFPVGASGLMIFRDRNHAIEEIRSNRYVFLFVRNKKSLQVRKYELGDCVVTTESGRHRPLPDAKPTIEWNYSDTSPPGKSNTRIFQTRSHTDDGEDWYECITVSSGETKCHYLHALYKGTKADPEALASRETMEREAWKEGPGFKTTMIREEVGDDHVLKVVSNNTLSQRFTPDRMPATPTEDPSPDKNGGHGAGGGHDGDDTTY